MLVYIQYFSLIFYTALFVINIHLLQYIQYSHTFQNFKHNLLVTIVKMYVQIKK